MTTPARLIVSEKRRRLRAVVTGHACITPASVYDAMSGRVAEQVGYEFGMLGGSVASAAALAAPDLTVITLTELAGLVRSICRNTDLALFVDADHGYGNALSVRRTIEELEHAGASGCSIEDTLLPARFGAKGEEIISTDEMVGKLKAAVSARRDPNFIIAGRSIAVRHEGLDATIIRLKAYAAAGVDLIFPIGVDSLDQIDAIREAVGLPIMLGMAPNFATREELAAAGVRIMLQGHLPYAAAVETFRGIYEHLLAGGSPDALKPRLPKPDFLDAVLQGPDYKAWRKDTME